MSGSGRWWKWRKKRVSVFCFTSVTWLMKQSFCILDDDLYFPPLQLSLFIRPTAVLHTLERRSRRTSTTMLRWSVEPRFLVLTQKQRYCTFQNIIHAAEEFAGWWNIDSYLTESLQSTSAILMENMDMYMLNPCSNKIWYVHIFSTY